MTLPTLAWLRHTTTFAIAGSIATQSEIIDKIVAFINASTYWKITASAKDSPSVGNGYLEIAPVSSVAGITEMRFLMTYDSETTPSSLGASNRMAPYTTTTAPRLWIGGSPNASTTGPNANPWTNKAYTSAAWAGMIPFQSGGSNIMPGNGCELGMIESAEVLCLYFVPNAAPNTIVAFIGGNLMEDPTGSTSSFGWTMSGNWNSTPGSTSAAYLIPGSGNSSTGSVANPKGVTLDTSSTLQSINRTQFDSIASFANGYTMSTYAILSSIILSGGAWGGGDIDSGRGFARQLRWGPPAKNGQVMTDGTTQQAIALNYHATTAQTGTLWFDQQR